MSYRIIKSEDLDFDPDDEHEPMYCPYCSKFGLNILLGSKILLPNEEKQPDYENWLQCARCGQTIPIYEAEPEATINDDVTTIDNPFDEVKGYMEGVIKDSKIPKRKKKFQPKQEHKDKDVQLEIKSVGENNVKVISNSNQFKSIKDSG